MTAAKVDLKRTMDSYQARRGQIRIIDVPVARYLMIDGKGDPNTDASYSDALNALYPLAYAIKMASKKELGQDYVVMPLEGLWWADDMTAFTVERDKSSWYWTMMILTPDWIPDDAVDGAIRKVAAKSAPRCLSEVRLETLHEGQCVQTLHVGPFDAEGEILSHLHEQFIPSNGLIMTGKHHEIYLSDARRTAPQKLRTILRQPVIAAH